MKSIIEAGKIGDKLREIVFLNAFIELKVGLRSLEVYRPPEEKAYQTDQIEPAQEAVRYGMQRVTNGREAQPFVGEDAVLLSDAIAQYAETPASAHPGLEFDEHLKHMARDMLQHAEVVYTQPVEIDRRLIAELEAIPS